MHVLVIIIITQAFITVVSRKNDTEKNKINHNQQKMWSSHNHFWPKEWSGHWSVLSIKVYDTGYPHDGRADTDSYPHDGRADKDSYPHDGHADKDSYPHDRHNQYIMLSLYLWLSLSIDKLA